VYNTKDAAATRLLIDKGANVDELDAHGWTPIQHSLNLNNTECTLILLRQLQRQKEILQTQRTIEHKVTLEFRNLLKLEQAHKEEVQQQLAQLQHEYTATMASLNQNLKEKQEVLTNCEKELAQLKSLTLEGLEQLSYEDLCELEYQQEERMTRIREAKVHHLLNENQRLKMVIQCSVCHQREFSVAYACGHKFCANCATSSCTICNKTL